MTDAEAIHNALGLIAEVAGSPRKWWARAKRLDALSRTRGLQEKTRVAIRYARDGLNAGNWAYAYQKLNEAKEEQSG